MNPFPALTGVARAVLEPADFEHMALPALADAALEQPSCGPTLAWRARTAGQLARIVLLSSLLRWGESIVAARWWVLLCAVLAGLAGCIGLQHGAPSFALSHAALLGVGLLAGAAVATLPRPILSILAALLAAPAAAALACVPIWGLSFDGARRWLQLGPLTISVGTLLVPMFAASVAWVARKADGWALAAVAFAVLVALALQPDPASTIVYGLVAIAASRKAAIRASVALAAACGAWFALRRSSLPTPVMHVEHAPAILARNGPVWFAVAVCALGLVAVYAISVWVRARKSPSAASQAAAAASGLLALLLVPWCMGDGGIPMISFGGSASVAAFVLTGMILRAESDADRRSLDGAGRGHVRTSG